MFIEGIKLIAIVAMTDKRVIGKNNDLPWRLPEDLKLFKRKTSGFPIIMGRKTFDSIGRPLPNRRNIVISRNEEWNSNGVEVINKPEDLASLVIKSDKVFIIGGAQIYKMFLPLIDELWVSKVHGEFEGDTFFPEFSTEFKEYTVEEEFAEFELRVYQK